MACRGLICQRAWRTGYRGCNLIGVGGVQVLWLNRNPRGQEGAGSLAGEAGTLLEVRFINALTPACLPRLTAPLA